MENFYVKLIKMKQMLNRYENYKEDYETYLVLKEEMNKMIYSIVNINRVNQLQYLNPKDMEDVKKGYLGLRNDVFYFDDELILFLMKLIVVEEGIESYWMIKFLLTRSENKKNNAVGTK